jgi:hypothetical protein
MTGAAVALLAEADRFAVFAGIILKSSNAWLVRIGARRCWVLALPGSAAVYLSRLCGAKKIIYPFAYICLLLPILHYA